MSTVTKGKLEVIKIFDDDCVYMIIEWFHQLDDIPRMFHVIYEDASRITNHELMRLDELHKLKDERGCTSKLVNEAIKLLKHQ
jgi:hypothetical protein